MRRWLIEFFLRKFGEITLAEARAEYIAANVTNEMRATWLAAEEQSVRDGVDTSAIVAEELATAAEQLETDLAAGNPPAELEAVAEAWYAARVVASE